MTRFVKDFALILLIIFVLFAAVNAGAWYYLKNQGDGLQYWNNRVEINPLSRLGIELRQKIFNTDDKNYLSSLEDQPALRSHPVLQFTSGLSTEQYTVGVEGIRYQPGWNDEFVQSLLDNGETGFVFGGSTTFGHGVPDSDTVVAHIDKLDSSRHWLNFGVNAHDSIRQTDKLLHLLRQGYRPNTVLFVDGLNDLTTFMASPYRTADKPRTQGFLIDRGKPALLFGTPTLPTMRLALAYAFPITHLYFQLTEHESTIPYGSLDANKDLIDLRTMSWHLKNSFDYGRANIDEIKSQWVQHYRQNISFIRELGDTFGFEAYFAFQPIGYMELDNPFLTKRYQNSQIWQLAADFSANATDNISNGELDMINCQSAFAEIDSSYAFVDATHYSPQGNEALAGCLINAIDKSVTVLNQSP